MRTTSLAAATNSVSDPGGAPADVSMKTTASARSGFASRKRRITMPPIEWPRMRRSCSSYAAATHAVSTAMRSSE